MEAPAGYGKTTAMRHVMESVPAEQVHWYTAVESVQDSSVAWFTHQIRTLDERLGNALVGLGLLNRSNAGQAAELMLSLHSDRDCYIIMDNFQISVQNWQQPVLFSLALRKAEGVHIILISQNFGRLRSVLEGNSDVCLITSRDLLLSTADILQFSRQLGTEITRPQAEDIRSYTEGWAAAVSLYLRSLKTDGNSAFGFRDIDSLVYEFFWKKLTDADKEILLRSSVFDRYDEQQLSLVLREHFDRITDLFSRVPLMRYDERSGVFYPHEILRSFLCRQLERSGAEFRKEVYRSAGKWYLSKLETKKAVGCFYKIRDYEDLLSCELVGLLGEEFDGASYTRLAHDVLSDCPLEIQARHPISVLRLCVALFAAADFEAFEAAMERSCLAIEESGDRGMMGEWFLVSAFSEFPDTAAMKARYLQAQELMDGPSRVLDRRDPFMFGTTSMWYLFYTKPGKMLAQAEELRDMMTVYNRLTGDHGAGAYELYMGEAMSVQGRFDESDIFAHRAALLSEQHQNASVTYGAALLLGINAIYQSDMLSLQKAIEYLENKALAYPFLQNTAINRLMTETVRGYLLGLMMEPSQTAKWAQGDADSLDDLTFTNFMIKTNRVTDMILKKDYKRAIASVEESLALDGRLISLSTRNFMYVGLSLCYLAIGRPIKAAEWLDKSLSIAKEDRNYTFIASFRNYLSVLFIFPSIKSRHADAIREIRDLKIHYTKAEESRIFASLEKSPEHMQELSERERQVAELAVQGLRNREIAERLFISEETVKSHIRSIFNKTNIDRRSSLIELLK